MATETDHGAPPGYGISGAAVAAVIRAVDAARDALMGDCARTVPPRTFPACLDAVKETATAAGLEHIRRVAVEIHRLTSDELSPSGPHALAVGDTLLRGVDVMSLLAGDARRQLVGYPPATLAPAVEMLIEEVARVETACGRGREVRCEPAASRAPGEEVANHTPAASGPA